MDGWFEPRDQAIVCWTCERNKQSAYGTRRGAGHILK